MNTSTRGLTCSNSGGIWRGLYLTNAGPVEEIPICSFWSGTVASFCSSDRDTKGLSITPVLNDLIAADGGGGNGSSDGGDDGYGGGGDGVF